MWLQPTERWFDSTQEVQFKARNSEAEYLVYTQAVGISIFPEPTSYA